MSVAAPSAFTEIESALSVATSAKVVKCAAFAVYTMTATVECGKVSVASRHTKGNMRTEVADGQQPRERRERDVLLADCEGGRVSTEYTFEDKLWTTYGGTRGR